MSPGKSPPRGEIPPDPVLDRQRQAAWRERSVERMRASREQRLTRLARKRVALERARADYRTIDTGDVPEIRILPGFIRLSTMRLRDSADAWPDESLAVDAGPDYRDRQAAEVASRPPATRLVHRRSNALAFYLTAVYVAHLRADPARPGMRPVFVNDLANLRGRPETGPAWASLAALTAPRGPRARRAQVHRALDVLEAAGLVALHPPGTRYRYEQWQLLQEDGSGLRYRVPPERSPTGLRLPAAFFWNGWHLVLEPAELVMLLAVLDQQWRLNYDSAQSGPSRATVALPRTVRWGRYGISGEVYLHAQQLVEFGLLEFYDPMPQRRRGKLPAQGSEANPSREDSDAEADGGVRNGQPPPKEPYQFGPVAPSTFDRDPVTVVTDTLTAYPIPSRLQDDEDLLWS
ncbi:hypothetical protein [Cryptosporangium phraense]|uniref:Uncharacterized protein n=1 Tax=Cryptosporangium phraense TaxID=2593070 RepID=A0A545AV38_9ACTN|nr:hypothetical protein [Cryptosporangium phraense]TQS45141.1 hypothetical protein FL583_11650 [Cryptosporangium phraense]